MYLLTADEMREMDRQTIENFGIPGRVLMENAGRGAVRMMFDHFSGIRAEPVGVAAGRGNNGGDGFVIARYLAAAGIDVTVYLLSETDKVAGDARANLDLLAPLGIPVVELPDENTFSPYKTEMGKKRIWVDAILGTGLTKEVKGYFRAVIEFINSLQRPVFAVDIASGVHTDTGRPCGTCIHADATATFAFAKLGHIVQPGAAFTGRLNIIDIGIPPHIIETVAPRQKVVRGDTIRNFVTHRPPEAHKGHTGHLMAVAGAAGTTGAAAMTAMSALRAGAGLVTLGVPETVNAAVEPQVTEAMTRPLADTGTGVLSDAGAEEILAMLSDKDALAVGPGMGTADETRRLVEKLVRESPVPVVVDADGINNLAENPEILKNKKSDVVLTPHPGEMARLTATSAREIQQDRIGAARAFAETYGVHLVVKGARTVIAHPDGRIDINPTGNPGMASGGMGDVLTGMIAGWICQGCPAADAAALSVYLHGAAADMLADRRGPHGYLATDVMGFLPDALKAVSTSAFVDITAGLTPQI